MYYTRLIFSYALPILQAHPSPSLPRAPSSDSSQIKLLSAPLTHSVHSRLWATERAVLLFCLPGTPSCLPPILTLTHPSVLSQHVTSSGKSSLTSQAGLKASPVFLQSLFIFYHRTYHSGLEIPGYWFISPAFGFPEGRSGVLFCFYFSSIPVLILAHGSYPANTC